jgi:hypothetical protein
MLPKEPDYACIKAVEGDPVEAGRIAGVNSRRLNDFALNATPVKLIDAHELTVTLWLVD